MSISNPVVPQRTKLSIDGKDLSPSNPLPVSEEVLSMILAELRIMNVQLAMITGNSIDAEA